MLNKRILSGVLAAAFLSCAATAYAMPSCGPMPPAPGISAASAAHMSCCVGACDCVVQSATPVSFPAALASVAADGIPAVIAGLSLSFSALMAPSAALHSRPASVHSPPGQSVLDLTSVYRV